jgi:DivIVA domain-containing protein
MEMSRDVIESFQFREARKGYDMREVDEFLEKLAVAFSQVEERAREADQRAEAAQSRIGEAQRRVAEAERRVAEAESQPRSSEGDETETLRRTLILAQRTADAAIKEAEEHAARVRAEADELAETTRSRAEDEARRSVDEARQQVLDELRQLEAIRDAMRTDVELLEQHIDAQREHLRASVAELQRTIDDPQSLRLADAPELSGAVVPDVAPAWEPEDVVAVDDAPAEPEAFVPLTFDEAPPEPAEEPVAEKDPAAGWLPDGDAWSAVAPVADEPDDVVDSGPPTQPVDMLAERDAGDDEYLAELRKAMTDESPLGPRDEDDPLGSGDFFDQEDDRPARSRFGRRR